MRYTTGGLLARTLATAITLASVLVTGAGAAQAAGAQPAPSVGPLIVGGGDATQAYAAMGSLQTAHGGDPDFHFCGAVLIAPRVAITNAHCVTLPDASPVPASLLHARFGSLNRRSGGVVANVTQVIPHPTWAWGTGQGAVADIAVLRFNEAMPGPYVIARYPLPDEVTRLLGWGLTSMDAAAAPIVLQQLDTHLLPAGQCAAGDLPITAGEVCVASPAGAGACYGDSGSPALQGIYGQWQIIGGASRETNPVCGQAPTIYTNVPYFRDWVYRAAFKPAPVKMPRPPAVTPNGWAAHWATLWR